MFDFESTDRKHVPEPDLVPILDGLTAVIFFLLLSISFIGMTKITMPPSFVSAAASSDDIPVSGKVKAILQGETIVVKLEWIGQKPGGLSESAVRVSSKTKNESLIAVAKKLAAQFKEKFPGEKSLQIALGPSLNYQELISIMDGLRTNFDDLVLSSYTDVN